MQRIRCSGCCRVLSLSPSRSKNLGGGADVLVDDNLASVKLSEIFNQTATAANHIQLHQFRVILMFPQAAEDTAYRKQTSARIHLAAGLPLTWVSEQKDAFKQYLLQKDSVDFHFRGAEYHVDFVGADIFPQGFAAAADHLRDFRGVNMLADIGNGTPP